jgi:hypothetical protein
LRRRGDVIVARHCGVHLPAIICDARSIESARQNSVVAARDTDQSPIFRGRSRHKSGGQAAQKKKSKKKKTTSNIVGSEYRWAR